MWNPMDRELQIYRRPKLGERAACMQTQGRGVADIVEGLRLSLRQAKDAITVRDEETRRLRSAVKHLEGALSLRERELQDTVLCLSGASPARPHQAWLQEGTPSSKLRLQVHRLQRAVMAKQDHIEHLNRQASLGFLREAREQADEYRIEAKRLARALAAATSGASANIGRLSTGLTFSKPLSPATLSAGADAGDSSATPVANRAEEGSLPAGAASFTDGSLSRAIPPLSQLPRSWAEGCGRGAVEATGLSPNENVATWQPLATRRRSGEGFRPLQPSLAWEVGEGARVRESSDARGEAQLREMPRDTPFAHPATNGCFEGFALGSMAFPPSAIVRGGSARGAKRTSPSRRRHGRASARIRYRGSPRGRGSTSPDRSYAHGEYKRRLSCMAASARLRSSMRRSAAERNEVLALSEEARRLQAARIERARRAQLVREKIARYREERIRELESRLARRTGAMSPDADAAAEALSPEKGGSDDGDDSTGAGVGDSRGTGFAREENIDASLEVGGIGVGTSDESKLQRLSRQRREIDAAIAAATKESGVEVDSERQDSARGIAMTEGQEEASHGRQRRRRKSQSSGADDTFPSEDEYFLQSDQAHESSHCCPARPIGKPPRAPRRSVGRPGQKSGSRRRSSVAEEVDEAPSDSGGGSIAESFAWRNEDHVDNDVDEVETEADGDGSNDSIDWRNNDLSDAEGSVWEENSNFSSAGWEEEGEGELEADSRGKPDGGSPPVLMEMGEVNAHEPSNRGSPRYRQRHHMAETPGNEQTKATRRRDPTPGNFTAGTSEEERRGRDPARKQGSSMNGVNAESSENSSRRRQLERNGDRAVGGRRNQAGESKGHHGVSPEPQPRVATRGDSREAAVAVGLPGVSGVRERRDVVAGDLDEEDSSDSRWSLSTEGQAPKKHGAGNGTRGQRNHGGDGDREGDLIEKPTSPGRRGGQEREQEKKRSSVVSETTAQGVEPDYVDDFFESSEEQDVPFAVSSPSDEDVEAYANGEQAPTSVAEAPANGRPRRGYEPSRAADNNTASNERLVNACPERPRRPQSAGRTRNANQGLLQPVLPPDFSYTSGNVREVGAAGAGGVPQEQPVEGTHSSYLMAEHAAGFQGEVDEGQPTALLGRDSRDNGEGREKRGVLAEEDGIGIGGGSFAPLKIDSSVLFASLSSSTAGASSSSNIITGAGGMRPHPSPSGETASKRQGEMSSSTFALSADEDDDDDDDGLGATPAQTIDGEAALRSSASFDANGPPGDEQPYSVGDEAATDAGAVAGERKNSPRSRNIESPVPSTPGLQLATSAQHGDRTFSSEVGLASTSGHILSERQSPSPRGNIDGIVVGYAGVNSTTTTKPSPRAEEPSPPLSIRKQPPAVSPEDREPPSPRDRQAPEDVEKDSLSARSVSKSSPRSVDILRTSPRLGRASLPRHADRDADEGAPIHGQVEGVIPSDDEHARSVAGHHEHIAGLGEREAVVDRKGHAGDDGSAGTGVGALEERSLVGAGAGSPESGSVLDVGGAGVDGYDEDEDDGYF